MSENKPLVTVLMPCYNAMPFLTEALESIIHQTYTNLEILCINDGSSDETGEALERYAKQDKRIRIVHNETNLKLIKTLNKGVSLATGEYIARMDADDIAVKDRIQTQVDYLEYYPEIDGVSSGSYNISEDGKVFSENIPRNYSPLGSLFASFMFVPISHPLVMLKVDVFKDNNFLEETQTIHTEDYELWSRLLRKGYKIANIREKLLYYRVRAQSVSRKYSEQQDVNFVECAKRHYEAYAGLAYSTKCVNVLVNRIGKNSLTVEDLKTGLMEMKKFKQLFIEKEAVRDVGGLKEIGVIYNTHLLDILFQAFKRSKGKVKFFASLIFIKNILLFFNKRAFQYAWSKVIR